MLVAITASCALSPPPPPPPPQTGAHSTWPADCVSRASCLMSTQLLMGDCCWCCAEELPLLPGVHLQLHLAVLHHLCHLPGRAAADQQVALPRLWYCHSQGACQHCPHYLLCPGMLVRHCTKNTLAACVVCVSNAHMSMQQMC